MKRIGNEYYPTFIDLLIKLEEECSVNSRQMDTLIRLNFFEEFGKNQILSHHEFYNKRFPDDTYKINKDELILWGHSLGSAALAILLASQKVLMTLVCLPLVLTTFNAS